MDTQNKGATAEHNPAIKSYVLRAGRLTPGQKKALEDFWPQFGIDSEDSLLDLNAVFEQTRDEPLPRNMSGKVLKRMLQEEYRGLAATGDPIR